LIGRAQTVDFSRALASTYECQCPCGPSYANAQLLPPTVTGEFGATQQFQAQQQDVDCYGNLTAWFDVNAGGGFSSDDTGIATINSSGLGTAVGPGTTNIRATWYASLISYEGDPLHCEVFDTTANCTASCVVKPTISVSEASKFWYFDGVHPDATNYPTSKFLTANPGGAVSRTWTVTAGSNKANFGGFAQLDNETYNPVTLNSAGRSTSANDVTVTVTVNGVTSNPVSLTVKAPHSLVMAVNIPDDPDGTYGYISYVSYTIKDWQGNNLPAVIGVNEKWTTAIVPDYTGTNWTRGNELPGNASSNAVFQDSISGNCISCLPNAFPVPINPCQPNRCNVPVINWGQDWHVGSTTAGSGRKVQTGRLQLYTDHGRCNNRQSPIPGT
jgi:hypothetical protein